MHPRASHAVPYPLMMMQILCEAVPELWYAVCAPLVISTIKAKPRRDVLLSDVLHNIASYRIVSQFIKSIISNKLLICGLLPLLLFVSSDVIPIHPSSKK